MRHPRAWNWTYLNAACRCLAGVLALGGLLGFAGAPCWLDAGVIILGFVVGMWVDHEYRRR